MTNTQNPRPTAVAEADEMVATFAAPPVDDLDKVMRRAWFAALLGWGGLHDRDRDPVRYVQAVTAAVDSANVAYLAAVA